MLSPWASCIIAVGLPHSALVVSLQPAASGVEGASTRIASLRPMAPFAASSAGPDITTDEHRRPQTTCNFHFPRLNIATARSAKVEKATPIAR